MRENLIFHERRRHIEGMRQPRSPTFKYSPTKARDSHGRLFQLRHFTLQKIDSSRLLLPGIEKRDNVPK